MANDTDDQAPWHAHVYVGEGESAAAADLRARFLAKSADEGVRYVGPVSAGPVGPHPAPQFEIHFERRTLAAVEATIADAGLTALLHPLTDDDLADHTRLARWIGEPLALDLTVLDPTGVNQGMARFGKTDL